MAKSKFEYVKAFELDDACLPNTWMVVRIDGRSFHRFSTTHNFEKPNDVRALRLMDACALAVMAEFTDIVVAYGESDEYSFVFGRKSNLYGRRESKIASAVVSLFSAFYAMRWPSFFPDTPLQYAPSFDARLVCYPSAENVRDYLCWRQADCHINCLYNTCFWALVKSGKTEAESEVALKGTTSADKNEMLFSQFALNYNEVSPMFRKGSVLVWAEVDEEVKPGVTRRRRRPVVTHDDMFDGAFYARYREILE